MWICPKGGKKCRGLFELFWTWIVSIKLIGGKTESYAKMRENISYKVDKLKQ